MSTARRLEAIIRQSFAPALEAHGFRRQGKRRCLERDHGEVVQLVDLQLHKHHDLHQSRFTVNLAVHHRSVLEALLRLPHLAYLTPHAEPLDEAICPLRWRLGAFMPREQTDAGDRWWPVDASMSDAELETLTTEVLEPLERLALPHLDSIDSLPRLLANLPEDGVSVDKVAALALLGHGDEARQAANQLRERAPFAAPPPEELEAWLRELLA